MTAAGTNCYEEEVHERSTHFTTSLLRGDSCFVAESAQKWQDLQETEQKRRALLKRTGDSFCSILCSYEGTFLRILSRDFLLWVTLGIYVLLRIFSYISEDGQESIIQISSNQITALGAVMTFFLVFFHAQYSNRFERYFQNSTGAQGRIFDATTMIKATLPFERGIRIVRYLNSAYILAYAGLSKVYSNEAEFFIPLNERYGLLTDEEYQRLRQIRQSGYGSDIIREVISWCVCDIHNALQEGHIDAHTAQDLRSQVLRFRGIIASMYDFYEQPILFVYIHFIVILTAIYLPLAAVYVSQEVASTSNTHWFNDLIGILALLLQCVFVIGIRYVAQVMRVPYAGELESLPVLRFAEDSCNMSLRIMYSTGYRSFDHESCSTIEASLSRERESLGAFWDQLPSPELVVLQQPMQQQQAAPPPIAQNYYQENKTDVVHGDIEFGHIIGSTSSTPAILKEE